LSLQVVFFGTLIIANLTVESELFEAGTRFERSFSVNDQFDEKADVSIDDIRKELIER